VQSFDYKAVGIQLRVRPRITMRRDVDLKVNLELSSIVPGQTLFGGAIVDRRETTTQLIVGNGQTVVISGILRKEDSDIVRKVPLLGDIPLLGALFRSTEKSKINTELLVFITPIVVDNGDEADELNEGYLKRLEERRKSLGGDAGPVKPFSGEDAGEGEPQEPTPEDPIPETGR
jgi:type II secretory pathway component GspD/PulD (secretin)